VIRILWLFLLSFSLLFAAKTSKIKNLWDQGTDSTSSQINAKKKDLTQTDKKQKQ